MIVDYADKEPTQRYQLMAQTIIPPPIAWIVTQNEQATLSIAPFSYFMGLSSEPDTMIVSIGHKTNGGQKGCKSYTHLGENITPPTIK